MDESGNRSSLLTGMIFSSSVDTDIRFDHGIFSPACRRRDLADVKALGMTISEFRRRRRPQPGPLIGNVCGAKSAASRRRSG